MKKGSVVAFKLLIIISALFCAMQMVSCQTERRLITSVTPGGGTNLVLLKDDKIVFDLVVSKDIEKSLKKKYPEIYDSFSQYFNIISDECIDSNVIYIHADTSCFDAFSAYDKKLYNMDKEDLCLNIIGELAYKDYYVGVNDECVMIVCGSEQTVFDTLQNLGENYITQSVSNSDITNYLMDIPVSGFYYGDYLSGASIAQNPIENYNLVYSSDKYCSEGQDAAKYLYDYFYQNYDVDIPMNMLDYSGEYKYEIVVGNTEKNICQEYYDKEPDIFSYKIVESEDKLYIMGGSEWALQYASDLLIDQFFSQSADIPKDYTVEGNIYGTQLFEDYEGSDLRLMSQNVWGYECNSPVWKAMNKNSALINRIDEFAGVFMAYSPDAICLQEVRACYYVDNIVNMMNAKGKNYAVVNCGDNTNHTPIIYNKDTLTLNQSGFYRFVSGNALSKSYSWAYFTQKETGEDFVLLSTHLWHASMKTNSNSERYRIAQMTDINTLVEQCIETFDAPCFVMGDLNCTTTSNEFKFLTDAGFSLCYDLATEYAENSRGRFVCNENVYSGKAMKGSYKKNAIDHALIKNQQDTKIIAYDYVTPDFYGTLSDHAALYIDVNL